MGLRKCPRCELNYIRDDQQYCDVCKREMKGEKETDESVTICVECGENPAVKGGELCAICLREARRQEKLSSSGDDIHAPDTSAMNDVTLDEIEVPMPVDGEIPASELDEIDRELGEDDDEETDEDEFKKDGD